MLHLGQMSRHCNCNMIRLSMTVKLEVVKITDPRDCQLFGRRVTKSRVLEIFQRFSRSPRTRCPPNESPQRRKHDSCTKAKIVWSVWDNDPVSRIMDMIRLRLIASTLIFAWDIRYSHLSCSKSLLRTWSSSSRKDRLLHGIRP